MIKFLLALLLISIDIFACSEVLVPSSINLALNPEQKSFHFYNDLRAIFDRPTMSAENCSKTAAQNKYLMISVSLENFVLSDEFLTYSINDGMTMQGDKCTLANSPIKETQTKEDRANRLIKRRELLNKCIVYQVTDFSKAGLNYPEGQPGCATERISANAANFKGPYCYFRPNVDSSIVFSVDVNPDCLSYEFFRENKIDLQDLIGMIGIYESGDASGNSPDLRAIQQFPYRISVNASEKVLEINSDIGEDRPLWPTTWAVEDLFLGEPKITTTSSENYDEIFFPVFASNVCEKKCVDGLCSSPCLYSQPIVAEYVLYEHKKNKKSMISAWFDGGVIPANWQGLIQGIGAKLQKGLLLPDTKYTVEINFKDQELNYLGLKGRIEKQISMNPNHIPGMVRAGTAINEVPTFAQIGDIDNLPIINNIEGIYFSGVGFTGVKDALNSVSRYFKNSFWPPYFKKVCNKGVCVNNSKYEGKLILDFTLKVVGRKMKIDSFTFKRKGTFFGKEYVVNNYNFPRKDCGFVPNDDNDDLPDFDF